MSKIDCLVCHDTTGTYEKSPTKAGMPVPSLDLTKIAKKVGHTSRQSCGTCHFSGGGGDAVKHGDMSKDLFYPKRNCDVHMGGYDFQCSDCHETQNHKISGRSSSVPVTEATQECEVCHTRTPHYGDDLLDHHLNRHCEHIDCNTCHSPVYAKCSPTKVWWDWSKAGDKTREPVLDKYGMPDYNWKKGEFRWKESAKPVYAWYRGAMERVILGDQIDLDAPVINITEPVGAFNDPKSRITPFKIMKGVQAADAENKYLLVPHLFPKNKSDDTAYWKHLDWNKAFEAGMAEAGLPYSGKYTWVETRMHWRIEHEVMPAEMALSCVHCHKSMRGEKTCNRCHQDQKDIDAMALIHRGTDFKKMKAAGRDVEDLIGSTDYIDFKALGYEGDPIIHGGRFKKLPLGKTASDDGFWGFGKLFKE